MQPMDLGKVTLHEVLGVPYLAAALVMAALFAGIIAWLNRLESRTS
jgi:hypothetical protein